MRAFGKIACQPVDIARLNADVRQLPVIEAPKLALGVPGRTPNPDGPQRRPERLPDTPERR